MSIQNKGISRVKVGCTVKLQSVPSGTIRVLKLISSHTETQYMTMGYKTKTIQKSSTHLPLMA